MNTGRRTHAQTARGDVHNHRLAQAQLLVLEIHRQPLQLAKQSFDRTTLLLNAAFYKSPQALLGPSPNLEYPLTFLAQLADQMG